MTEAAPFKDFTPRSQHSMAYDQTKDMVYITGGTSTQTPYMGDVLTYSFGKYSVFQVKTRFPESDIAHYGLTTIWGPRFRYRNQQME